MNEEIREEIENIAQKHGKDPDSLYSDIEDLVLKLLKRGDN